MTDRPALALILAVARNGVIGKDGGLPWQLREDMKHFVRMTKGHAVIMGRKTFDEVGKPLPKRRNLVISRQQDLRIDGAEVFHDLSSAVAAARETDPMPFVIGGSHIYREALPLATHVYLTEVQMEPEGDTFFSFDPEGWTEVERCAGETDPVVFVTYERP